MKTVLYALCLSTILLSNLTSCTKVEYEATPKDTTTAPPPPPETVQLHESATPNGDSLDITDSVNTTFISIGYGRGIGHYRVVFFKDSLQQDTLNVPEKSEIYNPITLHTTYHGHFLLNGDPFVSGQRYYWRVWYKERNIKSDLRCFFVK